MLPLDGFQVVNLSINLPGPVAAGRLHDLGADVVKIEPPSGDPLAAASREYYNALTEGQRVLTLDLKTPDGQAVLENFLADADLMLTAQRRAALDRLGLDWGMLHKKYPRLCHVAIEGYPSPRENCPGHDLTYLAEAGLLSPPHLPKSPVSDLVAAEQAVNAALGLLLIRERGGDAGYTRVTISGAATFLAQPLEYGLSGAGGPLGGMLPSYGIYAAREGYVALAALEGHFLLRLQQALGLERMDRASLEQAFLARSAGEWQLWAEQHGIPLAAVR